MQQKTINFNTATYVGIDAHPSEHTAVAVNRFEDEKGTLNFENNWNGIKQFLFWLQTIDSTSHNVIIGVEGRGGKGSGFIASILDTYEHVYEVNPQYTRQRRQFGTKGGKSDVRDAKCIAELIIKKLPELPKITRGQLSSRMLTLKRLVWYYEDETTFSTRFKHHLKQLRHEHDFSADPGEQLLLARIIRDKQTELKRSEQKQKVIELKLKKLLSGYEENLTSIPGVATILAAKIVAHADYLERFATIDKFLQYAGIAPLEKASGKIKRTVQNNKGNRQLNSTLYMVAVGQINHNPRGQEYYRKKLAEGKTKKHALRCVMKRIAMITYGMLKSGEVYRG